MAEAKSTVRGARDSVDLTASILLMKRLFTGKLWRWRYTTASSLRDPRLPPCPVVFQVAEAPSVTRLAVAGRFPILSPPPNRVQSSYTVLKKRNLYWYMVKVLEHGVGTKIIALLEESGLVPVAIDLSGSGIDSTSMNSVTTLADYAKPLISYIQNLSDGEKIILVGHGCGGASISYCMEHLPEKISKAIFVCATMVGNGQRPFDVFKEELGSAEDFMKASNFLIYGNGSENYPTGFMLQKEQMKALYFNQTPTKDIALAMVSMRPVPLGPIMEELSLTPDKYGATRRFYIQTLDDRALSPDAQEKLVRENPPEEVFTIKGSDHCPFFSKPQSLHKMLLEIAHKP